MAYRVDTSRFCFIHIPKTGGHWVREVMAQLGPGKEDGTYHGLPTTFKGGHHFAVLRDPADWLRSVWWHVGSTGTWQRYPREPLFDTFCAIAEPHFSMEFKNFAQKLMYWHPGIVRWFFNCYFVPGVEVVSFEALKYYLRRRGCEPELVPPRIVGTYNVEISDSLRRQIKYDNRAHELW